MAEKISEDNPIRVTGVFKDSEGNDIDENSITPEQLLIYAFNQLMFLYKPTTGLGKLASKYKDELKKIGYENFKKKVLCNSSEAESIVDELNPKRADGSRLVEDGVQNVDDLSNSEKLTKTISHYRVAIRALNLENGELTTKLAEAQKAYSDLSFKHEEDQKRIEEAKNNKEEYLKTKKRLKKSNIVIAILSAALVLGAGHFVTKTVVQNNENKALVAENDKLQSEINGIWSALVELNGFDKDQAEGKSIDDLIKNLSDMIDQGNNGDVQEAYNHFVELLSDLGLKMEDCLDEKGNFSVANFDEAVKDIVVEALGSMSEISDVNEKLNGIFDKCDIQKTDENGNKLFDKNGNPIYYNSTEDFNSLGEAIDAIDEYLDSVKTANETDKVAIDSLKDELEKLDEQLKDAKTTIEELKEEVAKLQKQIKENEDKNTPSGNESSDKDEKDPDASPVKDGDKDENSQENGSGDNGKGSDSGRSEDEENERGL